MKQNCDIINIMNFENISIGVDIETIERFENKDETFLKRIFSPVEIEYCKSKSSSAQHLAARYCAKEAVFKALSAFGVSGIEYNKIEVFHKNKVPCIRFLSDLENIYKAKLSLSHDKTKAIAYVIIEKSENIQTKGDCE